jgi:hypothetical protein
LVFVSHSRHDAEIALAILAALETRGLPCWIAPRDVTPGAPWAGEIVRAIERCDIMVLVYSPASDRSRQVQREVERAIHLGKTVLPFRLQPFSMSDEMQYFLSTTHWLEAYPPPLESRIQQLSDAVFRLLRPTMPHSGSVPIPAMAVATPAPRTITPDHWDTPVNNDPLTRFWRWLTS